MVVSEKKIWSALCASAFALSAMATATTVVSQPFATTLTDVTAISGDDAGSWTGYGSVTNQTAGYTAPTTGKPISDATDKLYLSVDGYVTCAAATTASKPATVDMMIQIAKPDEALAMPSSETTTDIQIAVGVDTDGTLKVYGPGKGTTAGWQSLGTTVYEEGSWHRVSFTFDYEKGMCQISLDGVALVSANGYLTSDTTTCKDADGSWYKLNASATKLASVKVVGSTAIDEVVVKEGASYAEVQPSPSGSSGSVPNEWLQAQGVASATADAPDGSGMKVSEKYTAGMSVADGQTYAITAMAMSGASGSVKATLTVPAMTPPSGYQNVIKYGTSPDSLTTSVPVDSGATSVELSVEKADTGVTKIYYKMVNEAAQ